MINEKTSDTNQVKALNKTDVSKSALVNTNTSLKCCVGFHSYRKTMHHTHFRMSTDKSIEWEKYHSGWFEFRKCERCKKMQYQQISTFYGRANRSIWLEMDKKSKQELNKYIYFNKRNNAFPQSQ
jgi:hypothetical protein